MLIEGYIEYSLDTFISVHNLNFNKSGDIVSSAFTLIMLVLLALLPFGIAMFLFINKRILKR